MKLWLTLFLLPTMAVANDTFEWQGRGEPSYIQIRPTDKVGAVAEVFMLNRSVHPQMEQSAEVTLDEISVTVTVTTNTNGADDTFVITPEEGYIAIPPEVELPEDETFIVHIYEEGIM